MPNLIVLVGPTAVGKTNLAIQLAQYYKTVIVSADSRQIYNEMSIGTAVPDKQQLNSVKHYMIQNHSVTENYNASDFETEVIGLLQQLFKKHQTIIFTGGSGLYINAVLYGIDELPDISPQIREQIAQRLQKNGLDDLRFELKKIGTEYYKKVELKNPKRIQKPLEVFYTTGKPYSSFLKNTKKQRFFTPIKIALDRQREELYNRINQRVNLMVEQGLIEEVKQLIPHKQLIALQTVGYKEIFDFLDKKITLEEAIDLIQRSTRKYARKQISWFRRDKDYTWFNPNQKNEIIEFINQKI